MAEKSLLFNSLPNIVAPSEYNPLGCDNLANGDDLAKAFSIVGTTGVLKGGLQVSAGTGLTVNIAVGKAAIEGRLYFNDTILNKTLAAADLSATKYDAVILRMNNVQVVSGRNIRVVIERFNSPESITLQRTDDYYDLLLGYAVIPANATSVNQVVDTRGWGNQVNKDGEYIDANGNVIPVQALGGCCPYFTAVKGYDDYYDAIVQQFESDVTMENAGVSVVTDLPTILWNDKYSIIEVYTNGLKEEDSNYTINTSSSYITITFTSAKVAGTQVNVVLENFVDGEGLSNALDDYNQWVEDVATLKAANSYTYVCNGLTDNQEITNIVNDFIEGGSDYSSLELKIVGTFGCYNGTQYPVPVAGSGTSSNPYKMFNFVSGNRKVILDFSNCSQISINVSGVYVNIFNATNITIKGLNLVSSGTTSGTSIKVFNSGANVVCENCRFWINGYLDSLIAYEGAFTNCRGSISNATGNSYCFLSNDILRLNGGEYIAYTGSSSSKSAIVGQSASNAVSILYGVNAPTISRSGFYQTNAIYQVNTNNYVNCSDLISALPLSVQSGYSNIRGTIPLSKN